MRFIKFIKNKLGFTNEYAYHPEAIIITCFFNPMHSEYRLKAFHTFYNSIKHLNHKVIECVIGNDVPQLKDLSYGSLCIDTIHTDSMLWHKESILNKIVKDLPKLYKYVFWVDADVIFTNENWLTESVSKLQTGCNIIQPFEYCIHLNQDETKPNFNPDEYRGTVSDSLKRQKQMWRSFCSNYVTNRNISNDNNYDKHGHVGFAWGARREVLDTIPLYDKALIGGADHIIAHAAAGQIPHPCIVNAFKDDLENVLQWSNDFYTVVRGKIGYTKGDLYHIWHGDIDKRQYLKRVKDFTIKTKNISKKDKNGLYVATKGDDDYVKNYFRHREVIPSQSDYSNNNTRDDGFFQSMALGYMTDSTVMGGLLGGNWIGALVGEEIRDSNEHRQVDVSQPIESHPNGDIISSPIFSIPNTNSIPAIDNTNSIPNVDINNHNDTGNFS